MQTKKQSFLEAITSTAVGFVISLASTFIIFPLVGVVSSASQNIRITIYFTIVSILRSYAIRRWFNKAKPVVYPDQSAFTAYCFECEIEMPVLEKDGDLSCSNCGLIHR